MRADRGCTRETPAPHPYFLGTRHETRLCPRRGVLENPWIGSAWDLWAATDGGKTVDLDKTTAVACDALAVIRDAQDWLTEQRLEKAKNDARNGKS